MKKEDYFIGLDMGTGSVGWAVTDTDYNVVKRHGKALWGVRLFDTANTAEERRTFRTSRRRVERRKQRIQLLQEIFAEEIAKVDPGFFLRLKESKYWPEDKLDINGETPKLPYTLFTDKNYTDKDFHTEFPTIYHLRKALLNNKSKKYDIRLLYLAVHHIIKHRGHFLFEGNRLESIKQFDSVFDEFVKCLESYEYTMKDIDVQQKEQIGNILKNKMNGKQIKKTELAKLISTDSSLDEDKKFFKNLVALFAGSVVKLSELFSDNELECITRNKISFADIGYDEYVGEIEDAVGDRYPIVEAAKAIYDWALLADMMDGYAYLSESKVAIYEKHKSDLEVLKKILKRDPQLYRRVFSVPQGNDANYSAYVGSVKKSGKKKPIEKKCSREDFYAFIKKVLAEMPEEDTKSILADIEMKSFLPKQVLKDNGVIPYQLHLMELQIILDNAKAYFPFLSETDQDGYMNGDKIISLLTFRIPYYVGPINSSHMEADHCWMVRKNPGKILPWNFEERVDKEKSAEAFIRKMTNKCTYLIDKDVLPKESLLYNKFLVLNELNNLRINGEKIPVLLKQKIYTEVFMRTKKVTGKKLSQWLKKEGCISDKDELSGFDIDFKSSLKSYIDFKEILTDVALSQEQKERIILDITLFNADKKLLRHRLKGTYSALTDKQIQRLADLPYNGWGRLSKEFLIDVDSPIAETGEVVSIIGALWETNDNLMQLLSEKYMFAQEIEEYNKKNSYQNPFSYQRIADLYVSPAVRRPIWQTMQIVKEIEKIMGYSPKRIFVEMAREKQSSTRTMSRKKALQDLYVKCKSEERQWMQELENTEDNKFRSDRLFLYYTQKGRCMYSGEIIELEDLYNDQKYDIDHIYPQSLVMDDSLNNRVLVKRELNADKSDTYPLAASIREKEKAFWTILLKEGFISNEKYKRLIRSYGFEEEELAGFIARQLVETRQSTKAVATLLQEAYMDSEIVYVKAKTATQFRQDFDLIKIRELNDYHHAKDAYINIVVGNVYFTKFTKNAVWYIQHSSSRSYNLKKMFTGDKDVSSGNEVAWKAGNQGTICAVKKMMSKNNILFTRRSYEAKGGLFDQQIMKKGKGQIPIKGSDSRLANIERYGAYNKASGSYCILVKSSNKKGKEIRTLEFVPVYLCETINKDPEQLKRYLCDVVGLQSPEVLLWRIKIDTCFEIAKFRMHLSGRTSKQLIFKGANQLLLSNEGNVTIKEVVKYVVRSKEQRGLKFSSKDKIAEESALALYDEFCEKIENTIYNTRLHTQLKTLLDGREKFNSLSLEDKALVLYEVLHLFQCQSGSANLSLIDGPKSAGILVMGKDITKTENIYILNQSVTGFYEQRIDLRKL